MPTPCKCETHYTIFAQVIIDNDNLNLAKMTDAVIYNVILPALICAPVLILWAVSEIVERHQKTTYKKHRNPGESYDQFCRRYFSRYI